MPDMLADITMPNMLYGKIERSPYPHAKILKLDIQCRWGEDKGFANNQGEVTESHHGEEIAITYCSVRL